MAGLTGLGVSVASPRRSLRLLRPLRVDLGALEAAFDTITPEESAYLDLEGGDVVVLGPGEVARALRAAPEDLDGDDAERIEHARNVLRRIGTRYLPLPADEPADLWSDADAFVDTLEDARLQKRLKTALRKPTPLRGFYHAIWKSGQIDQFGPFVSERRRERIIGWLISRGYAPTWDEDDPG